MKPTSMLAMQLKAVVDKIVPAGRSEAESMIAAIVAAGGTSHEALVEMVEDDARSTALRADVCWVLGRLQWQPAIAALSRTARTTVPKLREDAARALGMYASDEVVDILLDVLERDDDLAVRAAAVQSLGLSSSARSASALIEILRDSTEHASLQAEAAEALAHVQQQDVVDVLIDALAHASADVRYAAAYALGEQRDARALPVLERVAAEDRGTTAWGSVADRARESSELLRRRDGG